MWRLILKDIEQHAKPIVLVLISTLFVPTAYSLVIKQTDDHAGFLGVVFGFIVLGVPAMFAFLFIGQEKLKGTFKLLSTLPIPRRKLIFAKSLTSILLCLLLVNIAGAIYPMIIRATLGYNWISPLKVILWINLITLFFTSVDLAIYTLFESKVASQIVYIIYMCAGLAVIIAIKYVPAGGDPEMILHRLNEVGFQYWGWAVVILLSYVLVDLSGKIFEMKEWADLEEN